MFFGKEIDCEDCSLLTGGRRHAATAGESVSIERVEQREARGPCDFGLDGSDTGSDIYVYL